MELHLKKNQAAEIMFPMIDSVTPSSLKSGLSVDPTSFSKDGAGSWTSLALSTAVEISSTGLYTIQISADDMNHDKILIKLIAAGAAESVIVIRTFAIDIDDIANSVWSYSTRTLTSFGALVANIWNALTSGMTTDGSIGKKLADWVVGNVLAVNGNSDSALKMALSSDRIVRGKAVTGTLTTTVFTAQFTDGPFADDDHLNGARLVWVTGSMKDLRTAIEDFDATASPQEITVTAMTRAPSDQDEFIIV